MAHRHFQSVARQRAFPYPTLGTWKFFLCSAMAILLTLSALYVILSGKYGPDTEKWAYGIIGAVLGVSLPAFKSRT